MGVGADASAPERRVSVLVADDIADLRELTRCGIEEDPGFDVVAEAANGQEAIAAVEAHGPDVVLLDLSMPGMDGFTAIGEIRRRSETVTIMVLSGFPAARMREPVLDQGADEYVEKGTSMAKLRELTLGALIKRHAAAERRAA
jgi:CheY-like chemotaxis protein